MAYIVPKSDGRQRHLATRLWIVLGLEIFVWALRIITVTSVGCSRPWVDNHPSWFACIVLVGSGVYEEPRWGRTHKFRNRDELTEEAMRELLVQHSSTGTVNLAWHLLQTGWRRKKPWSSGLSTIKLEHGLQSKVQAQMHGDSTTSQHRIFVVEGLTKRAANHLRQARTLVSNNPLIGQSSGIIYQNIWELSQIRLTLPNSQTACQCSTLSLSLSKPQISSHLKSNHFMISYPPYLYILRGLTTTNSTLSAIAKCIARRAIQQATSISRFLRTPCKF